MAVAETLHNVREVLRRGRNLNTCVRQWVHTTDIFEHANALPGWQQCYDQLSPGPLDGWLSTAQADDVQVFRERLNRSVLQSIRLPAAALNILVPLAWPQADEHSLICARQPSLLPAQEPLRVVSPAGMDVLCLSIPLAALAGLLDEERLFRLQYNPVVQPLPMPAARLAADVPRLLAMLDATSTLGVSCAQSKAWLVLTVADWLDSLAGEAPVLPAAGTRRYIVERCHQWLLERTEQPPSLLELCQRLKISRRTLQYSFQSVAAVSPVQYLRSVRLNGARRSLRQDPQQCIAEVAARWGFEHPSYFSLEYQKLFGERPSGLRRNL